MTPRERILAAFAHREPDRVPLDLGATQASTLTVQAHERLRALLGLPAEPPAPLFSRRAGTVLPDEEILRRFAADCRPVLLGSPDGKPERDLSPDAMLDEWGVTWSRPAGGHYLAAEGPFSRLAEPAPADLEGFTWPDPADPGRYRGLADRARTLRETTNYAVVLNLGVGPVHQCQFLRGYAEWLEDLVARPRFAEALIERVTDVWLAITERALAEAGAWVDLVWYGDDVGTQRACLVRPELYRRVIKPQHRRMAALVQRHGKKIIYHSCGSVYPLIPDFIEIGIDALNPVQVSAARMDTAVLKREFGGDLTFWGGIDTQQVLPWGSPDDVRAEVRRRIGDLAAGGGYVLCAVHNLQPEVPPENIAAMYEAALAA